MEHPIDLLKRYLNALESNIDAWRFYHKSEERLKNIKDAKARVKDFLLAKKLLRECESNYKIISKILIRRFDPGAYIIDDQVIVISHNREINVHNILEAT